MLRGLSPLACCALLLGAVALAGCKKGGGAADAGDEAETPEQKAAREAHDDAIALSASAAKAERAADLVVAVERAPVGEPVARDVGQPLSLAVDDANVFWADAQQGIVVGGAKAGSQGRVIGRGLAFPPTSRDRVVVADGESVYWASGRADRSQRDTGVYRAPKAGGDATMLAPAADEPYEIALGDDTVYWLERPRSGDAAGTATLRAVPKAGGAARTLAQLGHACALAVDAKSVAWIELAPKPLVRRSSLEGGEVTTLAPANGAACSLAVDERGYYWPRPGLDQVLTAPKTGGTPRVVALVRSRPAIVASAGASLLVATERSPDGRTDAVLYVVPAAGGTARPLARGGHITSLAFDGTHPYWTSFFGDGGGGGVFRGPKP